MATANILKTYKCMHIYICTHIHTYNAIYTYIYICTHTLLLGKMGYCKLTYMLFQLSLQKFNEITLQM